MDFAEEKTGAISILSSACARNLGLDMRITGDKSTAAYRSRFLAIDPAGNEPILVIEAPTLKGSVVLIRPGQEIKVSFSDEGKKRTFKSTVLGRGKFNLNNEVTVPSLELPIPTLASSEETRSYYRLRMRDVRPVELTLGILAKEKGENRRVRSREKGILTDLGGGGLGFRIPEGRSLLLVVGARVFLSFRLPSDNEHIRILGRICFSVRRPELREVFFGVQFIEVDSDIEYKRSVDKILHFVAAQQRQGLGKRILINNE